MWGMMADYPLQIMKVANNSHFNEVNVSCLGQQGCQLLKNLDLFHEQPTCCEPVHGYAMVGVHYQQLVCTVSFPKHH